MDDLSRLLVQQPQPGARFGQGTLREWNPNTFEHVIEWRGLRIRDATILAGVDALTWQPGDQVLLLGADQSGRRGWTDWMVLGRAITPGPGAAAQAIAPMRTELARQLSVEIFADRLRTDSVAAGESTSSTTFTDLPTVGPVVSGVEIVTGKALVFLSTYLQTTQNSRGHMSFAITGATDRQPSEDFFALDDLRLRITEGSADGRWSAVIEVQGLNPGVHTFTAKYRASIGSCAFAARTLTVIGL